MPSSEWLDIHIQGVEPHLASLGVLDFHAFPFLYSPAAQGPGQTAQVVWSRPADPIPLPLCFTWAESRGSGRGVLTVALKMVRDVLL